MSRAHLHVFCGKMAAGKSTLAARLAESEQACLISEDALIEVLYPAEVKSLADYVRFSARIKTAVTPQIVCMLKRGSAVVLDFPGNTKSQREWFRRLIEESEAPHTLHYLDVSDVQCKAQLKQRSLNWPPSASFTSDSEFDAITAYFSPPEPAEGFHIRHYTRGPGADC